MNLIIFHIPPSPHPPPPPSNSPHSPHPSPPGEKLRSETKATIRNQGSETKETKSNRTKITPFRMVFSRGADG